jgi:predicted nuclease of predicted toxin-antitoxin system
LKLLLDQNLSRRLIRLLADAYPDASHVVLEALAHAPDAEICSFARDNGFMCVTKDSDFADLAVVWDAKVVWLRIGNCTTDDVERVLRGSKDAIDAFAADATARVLELF